ncbi:hypothetical protein BLA29_005078 [Euroglyphus maynei]|uniref:Uncharacterized protein n=1 Tax=Euroglyphus maynei TaxID=6958 RepID=A0A1Y3B9C7_EURMA|nr:hypothetical protein BLA29_005078 [Euroglyphus maynei]
MIQKVNIVIIVSLNEKCGKCEKMFYCGKDCQEKDWKQHGLECKIFKEFIIEKELSRFLLRLYLFTNRYTDSRHEQYKFGENNYSNRCFNDLMKHCQQIKSDENLMMIFQSLCAEYESFNIKFDENILFECFCIIRINCFPIYYCPANKIGMGIYIAESQLNHSCAPNAIVIFDKCHIVIQAIDTIKLDEQITISYLDLKSPKKIRRKKLEQYYYFICECKRCEQRETFNDWKKFHQLFNKFSELFNGKKWLESYQIGIEIYAMMKYIYNQCHPELIIFTTMMIKIRMELLSSDSIVEENIEINCQLYATIDYFNKHSSSIMKNYLKSIRNDIFHPSN